MRVALAGIVTMLVAGCGGTASRGVSPRGVATLRAACGAGERWDGSACVAAATAEAAAIAGNDARLQDDPTAALSVVDDPAVRGPFDRPTYARLWRQRGMAHALLAYAAAADGRDDPSIAEAKAREQTEHERAAREAFDMLLTLDPGHRLEYTQSPQATFLFQDVIAGVADRPAPAIDVDWKRDLRVGEPITIDVEVLADPRSFLARAVLFVRERGEARWRAADVELAGPGEYRKVVLPAVAASGATAIEVYVRVYDEAGNEVLEWASEERPREVPLRWDPPVVWWRKWWVWAIAGTAVAGVTGIAVYAAQWEASDTLGATVVVGR